VCTPIHTKTISCSHFRIYWQEKCRILFIGQDTIRASEILSLVGVVHVQLEEDEGEHAGVDEYVVVLRRRFLLETSKLESNYSAIEPVGAGEEGEICLAHVNVEKRNLSH